MRALRAFGANVDYLVPDRFKLGYGLTPELVELAAQRKPDLLITVDNGIASVAGVARANELGIATLITDHHLPGPELPRRRASSIRTSPAASFPSKALAGCGVMFYVMLALRAELRSRKHFEKVEEPNLAALTDLVALGTIADVVPLDANNRILVAQGLKRLRAGRGAPGIAALLRAAGRPLAEAASFDLGFVAGPRLNAAGRLADMSLGIECLITDDEARAANCAQQLDRLNRERRNIEATMLQQALEARERVERYPGLHLLQRRLAPGRGRNRGFAPEGPPAPSGHLLRPGGRSRRAGAARLGALHPRPASARRARRGVEALARPDPPLRRPCAGRRAFDRRRATTRASPASSSARWTSCCRRARACAWWRPTARSIRCISRSKSRACSRPASGARAFRSRCSAIHSPSKTSAWSASGTSS